MPNKIMGISSCCHSFIENGMEKYNYILSGEDNKKINFPVQVPYLFRPSESNDISKEVGNFVNGFKVVLTVNGEYAYVRQEDNFLLPYRYDIATDFNEYGFAMVGKNNTVSWIDKHFRYLNNNGEMVIEDIENDNITFKGVSSISNFSEGENPLYRICYTNSDSDFSISYFDTNGRIKKNYLLEKVFLHI